MKLVICLVASTLGLANSIANAQTALPPPEGRLPSKFQWYYEFEPKGWRYWSQAGPTEWVEQHDATVNRFRFRHRLVVNGCNGILLRKADNSTEVFIPDDRCQLQQLIFRHVSDGPKANWISGGQMQQTQYPANNANEPTPPVGDIRAFLDWCMARGFQTKDGDGFSCQSRLAWAVEVGATWGEVAGDPSCTAFYEKTKREAGGKYDRYAQPVYEWLRANINRIRGSLSDATTAATKALYNCDFVPLK